MGVLMRAFDWSQTPLGPVSSWSPALRMMARFLLANRFPLLLWWGPQFCQLYNDAYRPILGKKHPQFIGRPANECWSEIWHILEPLIQSPFGGGPSTWIEDFPLELNRHGFVEETHFTVAYSPVPDETVPNGIGGVLATVHEISEKIVGERRTMALRDLGASILEERSAEEACARAAGVLAKYPKDVAFALLYLLDPERGVARLTGSAGLDGSSPDLAPAMIEISAANSAWPLSLVIETGRMEVVEALGQRFRSIPPGAWSDPPDRAAVVPVRANVAHQLAGFLIAGISPRLQFDDFYRDFLDLAASQIATAVANARAYEEERKRAEALAELDKAKTQFFSNVSHEFRTPLTLMLGPLDEVLEKASARLDSGEQQQLEVTRRNALRLLKLVNTLLDFSRLEAGRVHAVYEPTDLASVTVEIASVFRSAMEKAGLRFAVQCERIDEPVYVDRNMWEKIILNLLSNAFKFTFEGEVALELRAVNGLVELSVRDTGVGIPTEERNRIFERFHRIESTRGRTYEGTGIGLALVQELVKLHGGTVRVESFQGAGSTFTVSIPLGTAHLPADRIGVERTSASAAVGGDAYVDEALRWLPNASGGVVELHTETTAGSEMATGAVAPEDRRDVILIADDNADMREYLVHLLRDQYIVHAVEDGKRAVEAVRALRPSLVLSDVMMPGLDGIGVVNAIRSDDSLKSTPVILLSARAGEEARVEGLQTGADDYLVKPFTARELTARVSTHVKLANLRREGAERESRLRAQAERERNRLQELLAQAPAAIGLMSGPEHRWVYVNEQYLHVTGRESTSDFVGKTIRESLPEIETQPFTDLLDEVYRTGQPYFGREVKARLNRAQSGQPEEAYFDFVYQPVTDTQGAVEGILVHAIEVTDKIIARDEIKNAAERLQLAESAAHIGAWEWDPAREVSSLSPELHRLFGTEADDPQYRSKWESRVHPQDWAFVLQKMSEGHRSGSMEFEYRYQHPETGLRWFYCKGKRLNSETRLFGIIQDVTARKQAQEELRESEQKYRDFVETATVALHWVGPDGTILWANQAELDMLGYTREEYLGHNIAEFHVDEPVISEILVRLCRGERLCEYEARLRAKNGSIRHVVIDSSVLFENGKFVHTRCFTRDITERKLAEAAVAATRQRIDADFEAIRLLHEVGMQCTRAASDFSGCLLKMVEVAVAVSGAEKGNLQLREPGSNVLTIAAQQGFDRPFLEFFALVRDDENSCCGRALRDGGRAVVEDVARSEIFQGQESLDVMLAAGVRGVQSTPLVSTSGKVLGMISTHFSHPHCPTERELRLIDLLARQAADYIEHRQAEVALHESEERFRAIFETTPECVKLVAPDGTLLQINSAGLGMVGADSAEMVVGKSVYDVIAPEYRERFREFNESICRGEHGSLDFDIVGIKGDRRHMATQAAPLRNTDGSFVHLAVARDITQRKLAERALRESEQKLRVVTDATPVMIWLSGTDTLCFYFNKSWLDFVGRTLEQEIGNGWAENVHPEDLDRCVQIYVTSFEARQPFEMEYRLRHHSGEYRWILDCGVPRYASDGTFEGYVGGCLDIHDKKEAAERTRIAAETVRRNNEILELQKRTLEMLVQGEPLTDVLSVVASAVRQLSEHDLMAAIHLLNDDGTQFQMAIAPDLPETYRIATEGMLAATKTGPCCWAVLTGEPVMVANVEEEERWSEFARFASPLGIRSASSLPIRSADGKMLATLAMYGREEGLPSSEDFKLMEVLTRTIALAIERQRTQDELRDSEGRLRLAQQVATIGTFEWDCQSNVNRWTPELEAMYGLSPGGFTGTQEAWEQLVHPEDRANAVKQVEVGFDTGAPVQGEWRVVWPDGSIHWILGRWQVFKNEYGQPVRMTGINIDITAQKKGQEALRTSEERFRALVTASSYVMYRMSPDWGKMWQLDGRGFIPDTQHAIENWLEVYIHPDDQPAVLAAIRTAIDNKSVFELENRVRRIDGTLGWTLSRAVPLLDDGGNIIEWFGAATDVTARREAEEAQRRLAVIVKSSDDAIISKDLNGTVTSWNPAAEALFGYSAQEMIGRSIATIIPPELQHDERTILTAIGRGETIDHFDTVRVTKSGERIQVSVTVSPIRDEAGSVVGAAKIARDITRQKQAEQALHTTERLAAVGRLAATVAHEINNPLAAVTNLVYLSRQQAVGGEIREFLASAEEELDRIAHLTKQTLGFYRESKTPILITLGSVVESTISVFAPRTRNKGVTIRLEIKQDPEICAGPSELRQLVGNLLSNSIDATESGGQIRIRISAVSKSGLFSKGVRLTVADSGSGVPDEVRSRIFEPFFTTKRDVGTGLGLWICKGIVERYSGFMKIRSSTIPGRSGTIISVVLPISNQVQHVTDALKQAV